MAEGFGRIRFSPYEFYYPVGNTRSVDITHGCQVADECEMLFLGCGDIRNVLHTLHVLHTDGTTKSKGQTINIHLNDIENGVLARNMILLYLVQTIDPANAEDLKFMWGTWYDCLLSPNHTKRLKQLMKELSTIPTSNFDVYFGNLHTEIRIKEALQSWLKVESISGKLTNGKREAFIRERYTNDFPDGAVKRIASRVTHMCDQLISTPRLKERYDQEVREYVMTGVSRINSAPLSSKRVVEQFHGNMTFFRPGYEDMWKVEDNCCPLMCFNVALQLDRYDGKHVTMSSLCLEIMKQWVESYQAAIKEGCIIKIHLWQGEATVLCDTDLPINLHFDFIDTSNIVDCLGLIPVLTSCRNKLKRPDGIVGTQTFHWDKQASSVMHYLRLCFDIPVLMYPTVFGFHLAEELFIGHERIPDSGSSVGNNMIYLMWKVGRDETELSELTILHDGTDAVSVALDKLLKPSMVDEVAGTLRTVQPSAFDVETREKVVRRIKGISKVMKQSSADGLSRNSASSTSKRRTIVEYIDHYKVIITTDPECLKEGKFTIDHLRGDPHVVVLINTQHGHPSFKKILRLSCGISINSCKITLSRKKGTVDALLVKDVNITAGERVLPWKKLELDSAAGLPDFPRSKYGESVIDKYLEQLTPPSVTINTTSPVQQLQLLIGFLFKNIPQSSGEPSLVKIGASYLTNPSQRANNRFHLKGLKVHENMPTLILEFFDFDKAEVLVEQQKVTIAELAPFYARLSNYLEMDPADSVHLTQGYDLLVRILELNSHRIIQNQSEDKRWIMKTFLRGRYAYKDNQKWPGLADASPTDVVDTMKLLQHMWKTMNCE